MSWSAFNLGCLAAFVVMLVGVPAGILLYDVHKMLKERKQNRKWLKHCRDCVYFRRIQFTSLDSFYKRGVVCDNGIDFEYVTDPLKCERFKRKPQ